VPARGCTCWGRSYAVPHGMWRESSAVLPGRTGGGCRVPKAAGHQPQQLQVSPGLAGWTGGKLSGQKQKPCCEAGLRLEAVRSEREAGHLRLVFAELFATGGAGAPGRSG
jgi:hypothetical protein